MELNESRFSASFQQCHSLRSMLVHAPRAAILSAHAGSSTPAQTRPCTSRDHVFDGVG